MTGRGQVARTAQQLARRTAERLRQLRDRRDAWIPAPRLDGREVMGREPRALSELLQGEAEALATTTNLLAERHGQDGRSRRCLGTCPKVYETCTMMYLRRSWR